MQPSWPFPGLSCEIEKAALVLAPGRGPWVSKHADIATQAAMKDHNKPYEMLTSTGSRHWPHKFSIKLAESCCFIMMYSSHAFYAHGLCFLGKNAGLAATIWLLDPFNSMSELQMPRRCGHGFIADAYHYC